MYSHLACDTDTRDSKLQDLKMRSENLGDEIAKSTAFVLPEILSNEENDVINLINSDEKLKKYEFSFKDLFRIKKHTLSEKEEELISKASSSLSASSEIYYNLHNADATFGSVEHNGKTIQISESNYIELLRSKDRELRKKVFEEYYKFYEKHKNTIAACYKNKIKSSHFYSDVKGYSSALNASLYSDNIDEEVYHNLIKEIHKYLPDLYDYLLVKRKMLNVDELHMYDIYMEPNESKEKYPFNKGKEMVFNALKPLGDEYLEKLNRPFNEGWIDIYPNKGKKTGAYQWSCYDSPSYVLLNYNDTYNSVSTMAHELGHAMHSVHSNEVQDYEYHDYPIFLAEIASTVNEVLLFNYSYENAKDKDEKINLIVDFLDMVRTTIFRQTMFAEFEMNMFDKNSKGISLTEEELSSSYYELNQKYFGENVVSDDLIRYEWMRIPHFYTPFYVYKYATGLVSALSLAYDILNGVDGARERYIEFLSSGGSDYPLNILKKAGVDITSKEPFEKAFNMFKEKLQELKELM